jgi:hypothetical protein
VLAEFMYWVASLPYPWCEAKLLLAAPPPDPGLHSVLACVLKHLPQPIK